MKKFFFVLLSILLGTISFAFNASADDPDENNLGKFSAAKNGTHSGLVQSNGALLMWGNNEYGQLGYKTDEEGGASVKTTPEFIFKKGVKYVDLARDSSAIIKEDNTLWVAGRNVGDGTTTASHAFKQVMDNVEFVSVGEYHTLVVKKDGSLWAWGDNSYGQLCNGEKDNILQPTRIMDGGVKSAYAGRYFTGIVKQDGTVWMCGNNYDGQLGIGSSTHVLTPQEVVFRDNDNEIISTPIKQISLGNESSLFLLEDGTLWFAGRDMFGDSCMGKDIFHSRTPQMIATDVRLARKMWNVTAFVKNDNTLYMCGMYPGKYIPTEIMKDVSDVSMGVQYRLVQKNDGSLLCWGRNYDGSCGLGHTNEVESPTLVKLPIAIPEGKTLEWNGKKQVGVEEGVGYSVKKNTGKEVGNYTAVLKLAKDYKWEDGSTKDKKVKWKIVKAQNPMIVAGKQASVKYRKVKDSDVFIARKNVFVLKKNRGALTFTKTKGNSKILVEKNAGTVKVSKGLKKGTYQIKVKVTAAGDEHYKPANETVGVVIIIK